MRSLVHEFRDASVLRGVGPAAGAACVFVALALPVAALGAALYSENGVLLVLCALAATAALTVRGLARHYPHRRLGMCNVVTAVRAALVCLLAGALLAPTAMTAQSFAILAIAGVALAMDGLDGWLARRTGLTSEFGARFDVEIDALFSAILALLVLLSGSAGAVVLVLGFARYAFLVATLYWPWLAAPLPERFGRKVVCVVQILALIYALVPGAPGTGLIVMTASAAVLLSFAIDIQWLRRRR